MSNTFIRVTWWGGGGIQAWGIQAIRIFICGSWTVVIFPSVGLIYDFQKPKKNLALTFRMGKSFDKLIDKLRLCETPPCCDVLPFKKNQ